MDVAGWLLFGPFLLDCQRELGAPCGSMFSSPLFVAGGMFDGRRRVEGMRGYTTSFGRFQAHHHAWLSLLVSSGQLECLASYLWRLLKSFCFLFPNATKSNAIISLYSS